MKLSPIQTLVASAIAIVVLLVAGYFYVRHVSGNDIADQIHEEMKKGNKVNAPPYPMEKIEAARKGQTGVTP